MQYRNILHMLSPQKHVSPFDINMALDNGYHAVVPYGRVELSEVTALVQDAIFSRGVRGARRTAVFIGGKDADMLEDSLRRDRVARTGRNGRGIGACQDEARQEG